MRGLEGAPAVILPSSCATLYPTAREPTAQSLCNAGSGLLDHMGERLLLRPCGAFGPACGNLKSPPKRECPELSSPPSQALKPSSLLWSAMGSAPLEVCRSLSVASRPCPYAQPRATRSPPRERLGRGKPLKNIENRNVAYGGKAGFATVCSQLKKVVFDNYWQRGIWGGIGGLVVGWCLGRLEPLYGGVVFGSPRRNWEFLPPQWSRSWSCVG